MRQTAYMLIELCGTMVFSSLPLRAQGATPALLYYADAYADHYGVPRVLVHSIISQESNWNPEATSSKGAAGIMQLMPGTVLKYGVRNPYRIKASEETVAKSLVGDYRPEHLFTLRQSLDAWRSRIVAKPEVMVIQITVKDITSGSFPVGRSYGRNQVIRQLGTHVMEAIGDELGRRFPDCRKPNYGWGDQRAANRNSKSIRIQVQCDL